MKRIAFVCVLLLLGCDDTFFDSEDYELGGEYELDDVLQLHVLPAGRRVPADGASTLTLRGEIPPDADDDKRTLTFTTNVGAFSNGEKSIAVGANTAGIAKAELRAPLQVDTSRVTATVGSFTRDTTVIFVRATPERLAVEPGTFALAASYESTTTVTATLDRDPGTPTVGTAVIFSAENADGTSFNDFRAVTASDAMGKATAIFTVGPTAYRGPITIEARAEGETGPLVGTATIEVVDP